MMFALVNKHLQQLGLPVSEKSLMMDLTHRRSSGRAFVEREGDALLIASEQDTPLFQRRVIHVELLVPDDENTYRLLEAFGQWADNRRMTCASFWTPWFDVDEARVAELDWKRHGHLFVRERNA